MSVPLAIWRILDVAANRAGEGLRVIEDYARFVLNDPRLSRDLKEFRHDLTGILAAIPESGRILARDTPGDVGTTIGLPSEYDRQTPLDVVRAAFKRVEESLRSLEEYSKLLPVLDQGPPLPQRIEQLRYRVYTAEQRVLHTAAVQARLAGRSLYLLVTADACRRGLETTVREALSAGVRQFQLREKRLTDRQFVERARQMRAWTKAAGGLLIINDRPDIAAVVDADGVHVGQDELSAKEARQIVGPDRLVGVSTHTIEQARQGVADGADYLGVGPTFPSGTKSFDQFAGLHFVKQVAAEITLPWYAIGGIDLTTVNAVQHAGATRVAVCGAICGSEHPGEACAQLIQKLRRD
jgi:thiamine-phosphate pyrophosphorylase